MKVFYGAWVEDEGQQKTLIARLSEDELARVLAAELGRTQDEVLQAIFQLRLRIEGQLLRR